MKILLMAPQPFYEERGTPIAVRLAAEALAAQGHEVHLLTFHLGRDIAMAGVTHHRIAAPLGVRRVGIGFSPAKLICDLWMLAAAARLVARHRFDVLHGVEEAVFLAWPLAALGRAQLVYDADSILSEQIADKWPKARLCSRIIGWFERAAFRRSDLVIAVCPSIRDAARQVAPAERVHLLPDVAMTGPEGTGSAAPVEDLRALAPGRQLALYVGNLEGYQGVDLLLHAQALIEPAARPMLILIGGNPPAIARHQALAAELGVAEDVRLLGPRPLDALSAYLAQSDILCSPRRQGRNTPMKIFSYMASSCAILATRIESHSQVLDDSCACLTDATPEAVARGMERLSADPALRARLGEAAAERARTDYSHAAFRQRLERAYAQLQRGPTVTLQPDRPDRPSAPRPQVASPMLDAPDR